MPLCSIPDISKSMKNVHNKFSVRYFLSLVVVQVKREISFVETELPGEDGEQPQYIGENKLIDTDIEVVSNMYEIELKR